MSTWVVLLSLYVVVGIVWASLILRFCLRDGSLGKTWATSKWRAVVIIVIGFPLAVVSWPASLESYQRAGVLKDLF